MRCAMSAFAELSISHQSPAASGVRNPASEIHRRGLGTILPASQLGERPAPPVVPWGIAALDTLTGGLPRGSLTEVCGATSSGRSSVLLAAMAEMTRRQEVCALVDASDSFDPHSAAAAGVDLRRLLWVRCSRSSNQLSAVSGQPDLQFAIGNLQRGFAAGGLINHKSDGRRPIADNHNQQSSIGNRKLAVRLAPVEQALKAADLLLQGGGFGMVAVDFGDIPPADARRVPLTSWFRFRRVVENTSTALLVLEQEPYARSCASLVLRLDARLSASSSCEGHQPSAISRRPSGKATG